jgi:branched-chain amino acid transport system ATP-binding protein
VSGAQAVLEVRGLQKHFGGLYALSGLDMEVREGEIVSVIGPNGAGKSTLFNVVTGIYPADEGDVRYRGESISGLRPHQVVKLGIARTFLNGRVFPNTPFVENALVGLHGAPESVHVSETYRFRIRRLPSSCRFIVVWPRKLIAALEYRVTTPLT